MYWTTFVVNKLIYIWQQWASKGSAGALHKLAGKSSYRQQIARYC